MKYGMFVLALAYGNVPINGWLKSYDPNALDGAGQVEFTKDPAEAMPFASVSDVMACWRQQSETRPLRLDGKPNRPLSAYTIETRTLK